MMASPGPLTVRFLAVALAALLLAGCATSRSTIVLMPDHDGEVGTIYVEGSKGTVTASQSHDTVVLSRSSGTPHVEGAMADEEVRSVFADAMRVEPAPPRVFILHYVSEAVEPKPEYLAVIDEIVSEVQERASLDISINGHTDARGEEDFNMELSEKRTKHIAGLLEARGIDAGSIAMAFHGEGDPLHPDAKTEKEHAENRRVEVIVR